METDKELLDLYESLRGDNAKTWREKVDLIHEFKRKQDHEFRIGGLTIDPNCNATSEELFHGLFEMEYACDRGDCEEVDPSEPWL